MKKLDCTTIRELVSMDLDPLLTLTIEETDVTNAHLLECANCKTWKRQSLEIAEKVRAQPQFDVPELVTQNIMASLIHEQSHSRFKFGNLIASLIVAGSFYALLFLGAAESFSGCLSWLIGFILLYTLKLSLLRKNKLEPIEHV